MMTQYIWDLPIRSFHWLLVLAVGAAYLFAKLGGLWLVWHRRSGLLILALLVFRLIWGLIGTRYARFSQFYPSAARWNAFWHNTTITVGHSPLGALMIFALLGLLLLQATLGLFASDLELGIHGPLYDRISSDWSERLTGWHRQLFYYLAALIGLHIGAIGYYLSIKKRNLITPMITGYVDIGTRQAPTPIDGGGIYRLLFAIGIAAAVFYLLESESL